MNPLLKDILSAILTAGLSILLRRRKRKVSSSQSSIRE